MASELIRIIENARPLISANSRVFIERRLHQNDQQTNFINSNHRQ